MRDGCGCHARARVSRKSTHRLPRDRQGCVPHPRGLRASSCYLGRCHGMTYDLMRWERRLANYGQSMVASVRPACSRRWIPNCRNSHRRIFRRSCGMLISLWASCGVCRRPRWMTEHVRQSHDVLQSESISESAIYCAAETATTCFVSVATRPRRNIAAHG